MREALPFSLKASEILIAQDPANASLRLAAASGFVQYASAFLDDEAAMLMDTDLARARALQARAAGLYLRGRDHALAGLEATHPGLRARLRQDPAAALAGVGRAEAPLLFWAGAGWAGAISVSPGDPALTADLPLAGALASRALALDEAWGGRDHPRVLHRLRGGESRRARRKRAAGAGAFPPRGGADRRPEGLALRLPRRRR